MTRRMYWGLAILTVLLIAGMCYMFAGHYAELREYEEAAAAAEKLLAARNKQKKASGSIGVEVPDVSYRPPPPGETDDTGRWDGNVWHETAPPKPKKKPWWQKKKVEDDVYSRALRDGFIVDHWELREAFRYHPKSPLLLSMLARDEMFHRPADAVMYGKKALRYLPTTTEDYSNLVDPIISSPSVNAHFALGNAYQKLGDYTSALVHLKMTQRLLKPALGLDTFDGRMAKGSYDSCARAIAAIKAGKPLLGPDPKPVSGGTSKGSSVVSVVPPSEGDAVSSTGVPRAFHVSRERSIESGFAGSHIPFDSPEAVMRARAVFEQQREQDMQTYDKFMREMSQIAAAKSPEHLEGLVIRELAKQWRGNQTQFTSEDFLRVFSSVQRQQSAKLRALEKREAELVREMARKQRPAPPRRSTLDTSNIHKGTGGVR